MDSLAAAHAAYASGAYSQAVTLYTRGLANLDASSRCVTLCNRASAFAEMDIYRKALADLDAALELDGTCLRALLLKGTVLSAMGREKDAYEVWWKGASIPCGDVILIAEMLRCVGKQTSAGSAPPPPSPTPPRQPVEKPMTTPGGGTTCTVPTQSVPLTPAAKTEASKAQSLHAEAAQPLPSSTSDGASSGSAALDSKAGQVLKSAVRATNRGDHAGAVSLFSQVLEVTPGHQMALTGRGTAHAYSGAMEAALRDFDAVLRIEPKNVDVLQRRGQVLHALGDRPGEMIANATQLLEASAPTSAARAAILYMRGKAYYELHNYRRAILDFRALLKLQEGNTAIFNLLGTSLAAMGRCREAIASYEQALTHDPKLFQAHVNLGQVCSGCAQHRQASRERGPEPARSASWCVLHGRATDPCQRAIMLPCPQAYRDLAEVDSAEAHFTRAVEMRDNFAPARYRRALLRHGVGWHAGTIEDLQVTVALSPDDSDARWLLAMSHVALGHFKTALAELIALLERDNSHPAAFHVAYLITLCAHLRDPIIANDATPLDEHFPAYVKHGPCKQQRAPTASVQQLVASARKPPEEVKDLAPPTAPPTSSDAAMLLDEARKAGTRMQVRAAGFVPNKRLQLCAGFAVIDVAQRLRALWSDCKGVALSVNMGWRAAYNVAVRWRQLGEPNDNVWWIDGMPRADFLEGFGSHTPVIKGQHESACLLCPL